MKSQEYLKKKAGGSESGKEIGRYYASGFDDGRWGSQAKKWGQPLESGKGNATDSVLGPPERT